MNQSMARYSIVDNDSLHKTLPLIRAQFLRARTQHRIRWRDVNLFAPLQFIISPLPLVHNSVPSITILCREKKTY